MHQSELFSSVRNDILTTPISKSGVALLMLRWFLFVSSVILSPPLLFPCEVNWGRTLQNPTTYSTNRRFAAILRVHEKVPDFGRRPTSLVLKDPIPKWNNVLLAVYDHREKISEFHVDFNLVDDLLVSDSGKYVVGILRTKSYPCFDPPRLLEDQIATIYGVDGTLIATLKVKDVVLESDLSVYDPYEMPLEYSVRTERDGGEALLISWGNILTRRVLLATGTVVAAAGR
jgi:hypothetical protein